MKQILEAGVRVFYYLEDRERTLDSATDKIMMSLSAFASEMERERSRQRTHDALLRKARAGHVADGSVYGYRNVPVVEGGAAGPASTAPSRQRKPPSSGGFSSWQPVASAASGSHAATLNDEAVPATIPRRVGRPRGWAPSTIRAMLHRDLYRGVVVWNKRQKLVRQGAKKVRLRSDKEWLSVDAPAFSIVSPKLWQAAHERLTASRSLYLATNKGKSWGRPANGIESPYLLTGLLSCGACGGGMFVHSHDDRHHRRFFYACAAYHLRSRAICKNNLESPMEATDGAVLGSIESDVLRGEVLETSLAKALDILRPAARDRGAS